MVINAAPARPLDCRLLMLVDILIVNEAELLAVTGHDRDRDRDANVTEELLLDSPLLDTIPAVVVTLGNRGALQELGGKFSLKRLLRSPLSTLRELVTRFVVFLFRPWLGVLPGPMR